MPRGRSSPRRARISSACAAIASRPVALPKAVSQVPFSANRAAIPSNQPLSSRKQYSAKSSRMASFSSSIPGIFSSRSAAWAQCSPERLKTGRLAGSQFLDEAAAMAESRNRVALYAAVGPGLTHYAVDVEGAALERRGTVTAPANIQLDLGGTPHPPHPRLSMYGV